MSIHMHAHTHTHTDTDYTTQRERKQSLHPHRKLDGGGDSPLRVQLHSAANSVVTVGLSLSCPALTPYPQDESMNLLGPPPASVS